VSVPSLHVRDASRATQAVLTADQPPQGVFHCMKRGEEKQKEKSREKKETKKLQSEKKMKKKAE
jgi:hypothetical protein